jgi:hypothetical protein
VGTVGVIGPTHGLRRVIPIVDIRQLLSSALSRH